MKKPASQPLQRAGVGTACVVAHRPAAERQVARQVEWLSHMSKRRQWLEGEIGTFIRRYVRKRYPGWDPNDRSYDRDIEKIIRKMTPEELDELMHGDLDPADSGPTPKDVGA